MAFKPTPKKNYEDKIRKYLLEGYIIRADARDETPLEVLDRKEIPNLRYMSNIGQCNAPLVEEIGCSHDVLFKVIEELEKDYSVRGVSCTHSGCCQYSTHAYYLD